MVTPAMGAAMKGPIPYWKMGLNMAAISFALLFVLRALGQPNFDFLFDFSVQVFNQAWINSHSPAGQCV